MTVRVIEAALGVLLDFAPMWVGAHPFEAVQTRADDHALIEVMGDHLHGMGEVMLAYRYMRMRMAGNRDGTSSLSAGEVLARGFMATPTDMDVDMHMFGAMYAPFEWLTMMVMLPYVEKSMDHVTAMGARFQTDSDGIGDLKVTGLVRLWEDETHHFHLNAGIGFPTGEIDEKDFVPVPGMGFHGVNVVLPLGPLGEHRLAAEALLPVYRDLDGPQLENDWMPIFGWQYAF